MIICLPTAIWFQVFLSNTNNVRTHSYPIQIIFKIHISDPKPIPTH